MKLCGCADFVHVIFREYPDIFLDQEGLHVYEPIQDEKNWGKWVAGLSSHSIAVRFNDKISRLWFEDLSKRS